MANKGMIQERITILGDKIRYCDFDGVRVYDTNDWAKAIDNSTKHSNSLPIGSSLRSEYMLKDLNEREEAHKGIEKIIECDFDDINWNATPNEIWFEMCDKCIE